MEDELYFKINFYYQKITFLKLFIHKSNELKWERIKMELFGALI